MSDSAFKSAPFPAYTTVELEGLLANHASGAMPMSSDRFEVVRREIERRALVADGDVSVMTAGERLRFNRGK